MQTPRPRLLLLPGLEGSGTLFDGLLEEFAGRFETTVARYPPSCVAYRDVTPIVRSLIAGSRPLVLVAESFSTPLAMEITAAMQDQIDGLVLCNGFVANPLNALESMMAAASAPWFFSFPLTNLSARTFLVGSDASQGLIDSMQRAMKLTTPATLCARFHAVLGCDARSALAQILVPVLYLHATRDRLIGDAGLHEIRRLKADVAVQHIDGPHLLLQKEPRQCAEFIARFVAQVAAVQMPAAH